MEIKKADSKGRVTGFEPGIFYIFYRDKGVFRKVPVTNEVGEEVKWDDLSWELGRG
jgi:hypothetical protein